MKSRAGHNGSFGQGKAEEGGPQRVPFCCIWRCLSAPTIHILTVAKPGKDQAAAEKILPLIHDHHLLLVTWIYLDRQGK